MRQELKKIQELRKTFTGIFDRYGYKTNWHGFQEKTILLIDIKDSAGKIVADHIWFKMTKGFEKLVEINKGDKIQFDARVKEYLKGYKGYREEVQFEKPIELDYKLNFPTKIKKVDVTDLFGSLKLKRSSQEMKDEAREGWKNQPKSI